MCDRQANLQKEYAIRMDIKAKNRQTTPFDKNPPDCTF
jgi:hypothetical protein